MFFTLLNSKDFQTVVEANANPLVEVAGPVNLVDLKKWLGLTSYIRSRANLSLGCVRQNGLVPVEMVHLPDERLPVASSRANVHR